MNTDRLPVAAALAVLVGLHAAAFACGACDEDKIAATYDHAVATQARVEHRSMVYGAIEGPVDAREAAARVGRLAAHTQGIRSSTVRVSAEPGAFSFVADRGKGSPEATVAELQRRVAMRGLKLSVVRVVR